MTTNHPTSDERFHDRPSTAKQIANGLVGLGCLIILLPMLAAIGWILWTVVFG